MRFMKLALAALALCLVATTAGATAANPVSGEDYRTLDKAQAAVPGAKVEVIEFFAYWCPHCNAFDPHLSEWAKAQGDKIVFKRVPVAFHDGDEVQQKMYYALEAMGKSEDLHKNIFRAIHVERQHLNDENSIADFVATLGVDRAKFVSAFESFGVQAKVKRASELLSIYKVDGVPMVAIDGRFETAPFIAGAKMENRPEEELFGATLKVMDWLVAKAAKEHAQPAAVAAKPAATGVTKK
ncbi:MAG TPA: thiol:disulfide interchange protein DsbA/DsbL [Burkholderiaceae bacterium]|jgi:thiol:disulfide interchange protein DsbA|nr:thiol:disulfide interchange protein DsbA/DsbL [Burkholderiaceae bacterium]